MRLDGKVALITGAGGGIGRETCLLFTREGAKVVAVDVAEEPGRETERQVREAGGHARFLAADVSRMQDCRAMVEFAERTFGALHIAFNNAGVMLDGDGDAESTGEEIWQRTLAINLTGVYLGCKFEVPALRRAGGGSIINTGSFVASMGAATPQLAYTASKGGVVALSRELAAVHARESIRVNSLCPGPLRTKLLMDFLDTDAKRNRRLVHVPMGRFGEAAEMARAALFLASDDSSYITGSELMVDGGITTTYVTPE